MWEIKVFVVENCLCNLVTGSLSVITDFSNNHYGRKGYIYTNTKKNRSRESRNLKRGNGKKKPVTNV